MTRDDALEIIRNKPDTLVILRDNNRVGYKTLMYHDGQMYGGRWQDTVRQAHKEKQLRISDMILMSDTAGSFTYTNTYTDCSILSEEEIVMALL